MYPTSMFNSPTSILMNLLVNGLLCVSFVALLAGAQGNYGYGQVGYQSGVSYCDRSAYDRATNSLRLELQTRNMHNTNNPNNMAPYSYSANGYQPTHQQTVSDDQCRNVRQSFNDLLVYTPICESIGSYQHQNSGQMLEQTRLFLQQFCERNQGYQNVQCYRVTEMHNCEQQFAYARRSHSQQPVMHSSVYGNTYGNTANNYNITSGQYPTSPMLCGAYDLFRNCSMSALQRNCYRTDLEHTSAYLMDHGKNLAYSCLPGTGTQYGNNPVYPGIYNNTSGFNGYRRTDVVSYPPQSPPLQYPAPSVYSSGFSGRSLPTNSDVSSSGSSISRFDSIGGNAHIETCIQTVKPFEGACTDLMIERQRDARHGRSSNDVQRRICCALFSYRDCLSRTVLERCIDGSTRVVEYLMGPRQQELSANCRDYTREQCSSATKLSFTILTTILLFLGTKLF